MADTYTFETPDIFTAINMIISDNFGEYVTPEEFYTVSFGKNDSLINELIDILHSDYGFTRELHYMESDRDKTNCCVSRNCMA